MSNKIRVRSIIPLHNYLAEFQALVRSQHDPTGETCHWTKHDELNDAVSGIVKGKPVVGPCDCPSEPDPPPQNNCEPHNLYNCFNTSSVLGLKPSPSFNRYQKSLKALAASMRNIEQLLDKFQKMINTLLQSNPHVTPRQAMLDPTFTKAIRNSFASFIVDVNAILKIDVSQGPSTTWSQQGSCECAINKTFRLTNEEKIIKNQRNHINSSEMRINFLIIDVTSGFKTAHRNIGIQSRLLSSNLKKSNFIRVSSALLNLSKYITNLANQGPEYFEILQLAKSIGDGKKIIMLGVIYHDQQLESLTCQPNETS